MKSKKLSVKVFISSAMRELRYEREVALRTLERLNMEPSMFELLPALNESVEAAYTSEVVECDIFVLIVARTFRDAVKQEYEAAVRYDKPIIIFRRKLEYGEKIDPNLEKFLDQLESGALPDSLDVPRRVFKEYSTLHDLEEGIRDSVLFELSRQALQVPKCTFTREQMYLDAAELTSSARRRLYVFQYTPCLIFGVRPYEVSDDSQKRHYELEFYREQKAWLEQAVASKRFTFMLLFDRDKAKKEIRDNRLADVVRDNIKKIKLLESQSGNRICLSTARAPFAGPLMVADDMFAFWIAGQDDAVFLSFRNKRIADELVTVFERFGRSQKTAAAILRELQVEDEA